MTTDQILIRIREASERAQEWALLLKKHDLPVVLWPDEETNVRSCSRLILRLAFGPCDIPAEFSELFRHRMGQSNDPPPIPAALALPLESEAIKVFNVFGSANFSLPEHLRTRRSLTEIVGAAKRAAQADREVLPPVMP